MHPPWKLKSLSKGKEFIGRANFTHKTWENSVNSRYDIQLYVFVIPTYFRFKMYQIYDPPTSFNFNENQVDPLSFVQKKYKILIFFHFSQAPEQE